MKCCCIDFAMTTGRIATSTSCRTFTAKDCASTSSSKASTHPRSSEPLLCGLCLGVDVMAEWVGPKGGSRGSGWVQGWIQGWVQGVGLEVVGGSRGGSRGWVQGVGLEAVGGSRGGSRSSGWVQGWV